MRFSNAFKIVLLSALIIEFASLGTAFYKVNRRMSNVEAARICIDHYSRLLDRYRFHSNIMQTISDETGTPRPQITLGMIMDEYVAINVQCVKDIRGIE